MRIRPAVCLLVAVCGLAVPAAAIAQTTETVVRRTTGNPKRDTLVRLTRPVTVDLVDKRLEDVIDYIRSSTDAELEPLWVDDKHTEGLDKETLVTVSVKNQTFLSLIERVLERSKSDLGGENSWQMSDSGAMQLGPKERLNAYKRIEVYDINDLITELPEYTEVPRIDLQQALQAAQGGGGGGGQSPFRETGNDDQQRRGRERQERANELITLLTGIVEPEQWVDSGGTGGSMRLFQGALLVNAPDYMHRGLNGYPYWPARSTDTSMANGRRYVTLNGDTGLAKVLGFGQQPVSAVVGGEVIRSNSPPPGGGGQTARPDPAKPAPKR